MIDDTLCSLVTARSIVVIRLCCFIMNPRIFKTALAFLTFACLCALMVFGDFPRANHVSAQGGSAPVLVSEESSTRALAFDSVTRGREPFTSIAPISFASDNRTRVMLFAMNLGLQSGEGPNSVTAEAEDAAHQLYPLVVEYVGSLPDEPWATSIVVCL